MYKVFDIYEDYRNIDEIESYWRNAGYPLKTKVDYDKHKEMDKLIKFNDSIILYDGNKLKQTMHGCGFLWTYFPHWINVEIYNSGSLIDNWNKDDTFKKLIKKTYTYELKYNKLKVFSVNRIRQNAKVYCARQSVSNFRPTVAKYLYNTYGNKGVVWDMSCGWGGRLLGFLASNCNKYIGTEPSTKTFTGLLDLKNDYTYLNKEVELHNIGSEVFSPKENSLDMCFTSPPYFNTEQYAKEKTQSFLKFPTKDEWVDGFLKVTMQNCHRGLKENGHMIINIANVKTFPDLEESTISVANSLGFELIETLRLVLSSVNGKGEKYEPVFIFRKINY